MTITNSVTVSDVSFRYPEEQILDGISMKATPGTITTFAGPNGCGKTTLLKLISGHMKPGNGTVVCAGLSVPDTSPATLSRVLGYVPQSSTNSFPFSVLEVVLCGRMPFIQPWQQPDDRDVTIARRCLQRFGISHLEEKRYTCLSGGERQMVMIARSLCQDPAVLLLDEPTSSLDLKNQVHVLETIRRVAYEDTMTIIMTLHEPNHACLYSDQIVLMRKRPEQDEDSGSIIAFGTPAEVMTPEHIYLAYGVHVDLVPYQSRRIIVPQIQVCSAREARYTDA